MMYLRTVETFTIEGRGVAHVVYVGKSDVRIGDKVICDSIVRTVTGVVRPISQGMTALVFEPMNRADRLKFIAINRIIEDLQNGGNSGISPGTDLRPIAERIYQNTGRDIMEARKAEMGEASQ